MEAKYAVLGAKPDFQKLRAAAPVHATWDDHDYGVNDGGAEYTPRDEAQRIFIDFWKDPPIRRDGRVRAFTKARSMARPESVSKS